MSQHSRDNPGGGEYEGYAVEDVVDMGVRFVTPHPVIPGVIMIDLRDDGTGNVTE
jgi:hypothetical protein